MSEIPAFQVAHLGNFGVVDLSVAFEAADDLLTSCAAMLPADLTRLLESFRADVRQALEDKEATSVSP